MFKTNKQMINFFIGLGVFAGILGVISIAGYRIYSGKIAQEKEENAVKQRKKINDNIVKIDLSKKAASKNVEKSTKKVIDKIDKVSKSNAESQDKILKKLENLSNNYKDPNGIYKNEVKWGTVINFNGSDDEKTFTIERIDFDKPIKKVDDVFTPFRFRNYKIKINKVKNLTILMPPGVDKAEGIILEKTKKD